MNVQKLIEIIGSDFYTGVPDSQLKALCNYMMNTYGIDPKHHVIAANEGNCVALAAGYHLATGKTPVVYMQNSGEGNIVNPVASLLNDKVYAIPMVFIIGWRGEPGIHDEPQHIYQGEITIKLLDDLGIASFIIGKETTEQELADTMEKFRDNKMSREEIIQHIVKFSGEDPIVSTTGKASRELFETRVANGQDHKYDFLTVGSMGHASTIALGVAINKPNQKIWCIDGDGAALMHMGAMPVIGATAPQNLVHIVINNSAHETVGGMPTVAKSMDLVAIAKACGYPQTACVDNFEDLDKILATAKKANSLFFIEIKCSIGARDDLGRPTTTALENKIAFMNHLKTI